jgi:thiol-disulfide isomerase/thioredoxin
MKLFIIFISALLNLSLEVFSQSNTSDNHPLSIGDNIPNLTINNIINYKTKSAKLFDFKGKLIILDFWATWCTPCTSALPRLDSLQKIFGDKIVIIPVSELRNHDDETKVRALLKKIGLPNLLSIIEDTELEELFPHNMIPHDVWIDANGKVISITSSDEVTYSNISKALNNESFTLEQKKDQMGFDWSKPLLVNGNGGVDSGFSYRSIFTNEIKGIPGLNAFFREEDGKSKSFIYTNGGFLNLFYCVYSMWRNPANFNCRCVFIEEGNRRYMLKGDEWKKFESKFGVHCYNLTLPHPVTDSIFFRKYVLEDLNRLLPYIGSIQKAVIPSLVIIRTQNHNPKDLLSSDDSIPKIIYKGGIITKIRNKPFDELLAALRMYPDTPPIINETGYSTEKINMVLNLKESYDEAFNKPLDINYVRTALRKYGLDIIEANDRLVDVLVLAKKQVED